MLGLRPSRVSVVRPGVDDAFVPGGSRSPRPLVVAVGRLVPVKRFDLLMDALAQVRRSVPDLRAVIVGEGYERARLEAHRRALGAEAWLELPGYRDDRELLDLYRGAWVLASTSQREGWGMTISEAGACATPAVVSRIAGHVDAVEDGVSGLVVDVDADRHRPGERGPSCGVRGGAPGRAHRPRVAGPPGPAARTPGPASCRGTPPRRAPSTPWWTRRPPGSAAAGRPVLAVGLTGGIGSGKSTVGELLVQRGAVLIDADRIAREVVVPGGPAYQPLVDRFGPGILAADGTIDRAALAAARLRRRRVAGRPQRHHPSRHLGGHGRAPRRRGGRRPRRGARHPPAQGGAPGPAVVGRGRGGRLPGRDRRRAPGGPAGLLRPGRRGPHRRPGRPRRAPPTAPTSSSTTRGTGPIS